jgi:putative tricarboxylic transport membrane protein
MVRADLYTAAALLALGVATMVESWRMPRFEEVGADVWSSPGVVPGLLGAALALMAVILLLRSLAALRRPAEGPAAQAVAEPASGGWGRAALSAGLCILYAAVLVGRMPFWLATFLFVFAFVTVFDLWGVAERPPLARVLLMAAAVAAGTAIVIPYIFQSIFLVRLP